MLHLNKRKIQQNDYNGIIENVFNDDYRFPVLDNFVPEVVLRLWSIRLYNYKY